MPMRINDSSLSKLYTQLQTARRSDPGVKLDDSKVLELMAAVGDSSSSTAAKVLTQLKQPGMTRQQQFDLANKGLSASEKKDLAQILDAGDVPLTSGAKNFLEALAGRAALDAGQAPLAFKFDAVLKSISGNLAPGVTIEAINTTTAPGGRLHLEDTVELGKTDQFGKFMGNSNVSQFMGDAQGGDLIRFRTRDASGKVGEWQTVSASGNDTRNAVLAQFRIGLTDAGAGKVSVANINGSRQISEPGAKVQFANSRTGEKVVVTLDANGQFPADLKLNGKPGDQFTVAASDGKNNASFTTIAGTLSVPGATTTTGGRVDLPDPKLHKDEMNADGTPKFSKKTFSGPLFKDGVDMGDVQQGQLGDCYLPAAMAAVAKANPDAIKNAIKQNDDGTFTVTFKKRDWRSGAMTPVEIKVDGDLYARSWGGPLYGSSAGDKSEKGMEMWFPIMEKAYAVFKGGAEGYNGIGNGGVAGDVMEAVTGLRSDYSQMGYMKADAVFAKVKASIDGKLPIAAGTHGEEDEAKYTNTGVYADHAYSIVGYKTEGGKNFVQLRNPWGESEPAGNGPNDGVFYLPVEKFMELYQSIMTVTK